MAVLPPPDDASRVSCFLADHPRWSAYWDKKQCLRASGVSCQTAMNGVLEIL